MKLTFCSNVVIFVRCFVLASAILGIPALAIMWDWLPGNLNTAVASIIPNRSDREFVTVVESGKPLTSELPVATELPAEFAKWENTPLVSADEAQSYGVEAKIDRSESSLAKGFEVRASNFVADQNAPMPIVPVSGQRPEDAVIPSQTLVQTSSPVAAVVSSEPVQYYHGHQNSTQADLLKEELKALGVECFNLQQWGNSGMLWRCSCQVRGGVVSGGLAACFEAVDTDSNRAITIVLAKIKDWKAHSAARGI